MTDTGEQSVYTPNALNQYTDLNGGRLYYDANFNLMWTGGFSAGYDSENHLTAIGSGEDYGQFVYDGLGRCLKRTIDWETTLITYDGWQPIVEWDEWNNLKAWNVYGDGPDEILYRHDAIRGDLRYHLDRMGNVVFLLDSDGDGIERYTYDAFGHPTVTDWNGDNPRTWSAYGNRFMFTGREYFPELGLYDYRNRFYYPALGRFLQSDPLGFDAGDMNFFRYCGHDPVNGSDPSGLHDLGDDWEIAAWNAATTERVVVKGNPIYDILFAENPFADPTRFTTAGLFDRWSNASLQEYYNNISHEFGLRESQFDLTAASPAPVGSGTSAPVTPARRSPTGPIPIPSLRNTTYFFGYGGTGIAGTTGGTVHVGYYFNNGRFGRFITRGGGSGLDVGRSFAFGYVNGTVEDFKGSFHNGNISIGTQGGSVFSNANMQRVGYGGSIGPGLLPVSYSATDTWTDVWPGFW
jgi:RHS repeat-associated protein